ncbi:MAG: class I SAM-dependent methyltransferase [Chloroflexota bacterium]
MDYTDMLARLGVGSAHPGGFSATLEQLRQFPIPPGTRVLEVGCGTGRTACHLARTGAIVTAVDLHPKMVAKARLRAKSAGVDVNILQADARSLPFPDRQFDVVLVESVSVFTDTPRVLREYRRVLKPGGHLYDREIIALRPLPPRVAKVVRDFFGVSRLWTREQWLLLLRGAGFRRITAWRPTRITPHPPPETAVDHDYGQLVDFGSAVDPRSLHTTARYEEIMRLYGKHFGYAVLTGTRPGGGTPQGD